MKTFAMKDETSMEFPDDAEWCVYWYEAGSYEGSGSAYAGNAAGKFWETSLGHCSCYGPCDEKSQWSEIGLSDLKMHLIGDTLGIAEKIKAEKLADI